MNFLSLDLLAYGHFTNQSIAFAGNGCGLHLVYGPNEAGKSTALAALADFLFGFGQKSAYAFVHDYPDLRIGAHLMNRSGEQLHGVVRRKGGKNTLADSARKPLPDSVLLPFLRGMERRKFENLYGLNHQRLRDGGRSIAEGKGEVGVSLFEAGAGLLGVHQALHQLRDQTKSLFLPRGQNQNINKTRRAYDQAKADLRQTSLAFTEWTQLDNERAQVEQELASLAISLEALNTKKNRLERLRRLLPWLAKRAILRQEMASLADVPLISPTASSERLKIQQKIYDAKKDQQRSLAEKTAAAAELNNLSMDPVWLSHQQEIKDLVLESGELRKISVDLSLCKIEWEELNRRLTVLWQETGFSAKNGQDPSLPSRLEVVELREWIGEWAQWEERLASAKQTATEREREAQACIQALKLFLEPWDATPLESLLQGIREEGIMETQLINLAADADRLENEAMEKMATLPMWSGDLPSLAAMAIPAQTQLERFCEDFSRLDRSLQLTRERIHTHLADAEKIATELKPIAQVGELTNEAVAQARTARDQGWQLIRRICFGDGVRETAKIQIFAGNDPLEVAFEKSLLTADDLADRRMAAAERVSQYQELQKRAKQVRETLSKERQHETNFLAEKTRLLSSWQEIWSGTKIRPGLPNDMRDWPKLREDILERWHKIQLIQKQIQALRETLFAAQKQVSGWLAKVQGPEMFPGEKFHIYLRRVDAFLAAHKQSLAQKAALEKSLAETTEQRKGDLERIERIGSEHAEIRARCAAKLATFGQTAPMGFKATQILLDLFEEIRSEQKSINALRERMDAMEERYNHFQTRIHNLLGRLPITDTPSWDNPLEIVYFLDNALQQTLSQEQRRQALVTLVARWEKSVRQASEEIIQSENTLEILKRSYGGVAEADMEAVEIRANRRQECQEELRTLELSIIREGEGWSLEHIVSEAKQVDGDALLGQITTVEAEIRDVTTNQNLVSGRQGELRRDLSRMKGGEEAAQAAQEMENALTRIAADTETYLHTHLAAELLSRTIARFREQRQDPVLQHASRFFQTLTLGSFSRLETDFDEKDQTVFLGIRPSGERLTVDAMSDGTQDQLFLALRLASIAAMDDGQEPMPFILDDALIHFDDDRAGAALKLFASLGKDRQILYFTHHPHLLDVAKNCLREAQFNAYQI